jgi:hypothetical protein
LVINEATTTHEKRSEMSSCIKREGKETRKKENIVFIVLKIKARQNIKQQDNTGK